MNPPEARDATLQRITQRLEKGFAAHGKTWLERIDSIEKKIPAGLVLQLRELPHLQAEAFTKSAALTFEQLELLSQRLEPEVSDVWTEAQRNEARAKPEVNVQRSRNTPRPNVASRLAWWLHDTRTGIPKRAYALSRRWRISVTLLFAVLGAVIGWLTFGLGAAAMMAAIAAMFAWLMWSENSLARGMWLQTRVVEWGFAFFRGSLLVMGILLLLIVASVTAWLIARYWNTR